MSKIIGIDLGTNNAVIAYLDGREPKVIPIDGGRTTPSVVAWDDRGDDQGGFLVGTAARRQAVTNPENTIFAAKRFLGRRFEHVGEEARRVPYRVVATSYGESAFEVRGRVVTPVEVTARVIEKLKKAAEAELRETITEAVIAVPSYFDGTRWEATREAARMAGIEARYVNEPTAAAFAYRLHKRERETILVYDLGGGSFDVTVLEARDGGLQILATNGDTFMGGDDFDRLIVDWMVTEFRRTSGDAGKDRPGVDLRQDRMALQRLIEAAEKAKIELSSMEQTTINLPFIAARDAGPVHLDQKLSRSSFERMIGPLVDRSMAIAKQALLDAKKSSVNEVVVVGGSTRVPLVVEKLRSSGLAPTLKDTPDVLVAMGAAVSATVAAAPREAR